MTVTNKVLLTGIVVETLIILSGLYVWFFTDVIGESQYIFLFTSFPIVFSWILLCWATVLVFRRNR